MMLAAMFESAEIAHVVDERRYDREAAKLRASLLEAQEAVVRAAEFPVVVVVAGVGGSGKGDVVNLLAEWMDPHDVQVHAFGEPSDEERRRPPMWRFWRALPPKGKCGILFGAWHSALIDERVAGRLGAADLGRSLAEIVRFERMLVDEGAVVVKLWLHLTKKDQKKRLKRLESRPETAWQVSEQNWKDHARYARFRKVSEVALRETSTAEAPWTVVSAADARYRNLTVARTLRDAVRGRLDRGRRVPVVRAAPPPPPPLDARDVIGELDLSKALAERAYKERLPVLQGRLNDLSRHRDFGDLAMAVVFEGNDAAGKGGAIRRVTAALDARRYEVVPIGPPTEEERAQPYLWRFWRAVPAKGHVALFDRSWYGRVLVERVEGFAAEPDWMRAYREIIDFEAALMRFGVVVVKVWLAVSRKEQLARFRERQHTPFKRYKITPDDWRNRKKWDAYERAACDMVDRTSTDVARWHLIEANDKKWARIRVLETVCDALENALGEGIDRKINRSGRRG
jgi:polyphosphate:AMP phosphotransferase